ncbi:anthranilate synthase component I family protein [Muriicola sp. Z0-33]|uniref:anthranilate synthase component I family protein n=1 Tax=Muriicola sp. Z0-33 TaxID=2816957 RepID=UPI002238E9D7|nr:anthranilate synthase component I family protein [Muriicola sp. Z0-33]MCW5515449.1 anthranilate synthase component I family protein [Muriicola sp. Z0-33]
MRKEITFKLKNLKVFKSQLLQWASQFHEVAWLDSNEHSTNYHTYDAILAVDALTSLKTDYTDAFDQLQEYHKQTGDWLFGYLSYDLKNDVEALSSDNADGLEFPDLYFFQPKKLISIKGENVVFSYLNMVADEINEDFKKITRQSVYQDSPSTEGEVKIKLRIFKDAYYSQVQKMLAHIHRGDIYEANFCQEFYAENTVVDPLKIYRNLNAISQAPFAAYLRLEDKYLLSASPERYLLKQGNKVISQPIKGTAKRSEQPAEDLDLKNRLKNDAKERAENIMIVDLVRNDLSKSALKGSVEVEELCEVYSFKQVHQMISTITALVSENKNPIDIIRETFPMGSMTGAPKVSAMKIIEDLEATRRGLYSGAVGYISPENNFDFNVVIRSILYNQSRQFVSYSVGSAITSKAVPEKEYEECLLKAKAMRQVLEA